jgi:hypothetical protein
MYKVEKNPNLKIGKVDMNVDKILAKGIPDPLPEKSFCMVLVGASGSGKSNLMYSLLKEKKKKGIRKSYRKVFNHIIVCSPSMASAKDNIFEELDDYKKWDEFGIEFLNFVDEHTKFASEQDPPETTLVLLDDVGSQLRRNQNIEKTLVSLLQNRRHRRLSCMMLVQQFKNLPTGIRSNCTHAAIFRPVNTKEAVAIHEELLAPIPKKDLSDFFDFVYDKKYNFLFLDLSLQVSSQFRLFQNFDLISNL